MLALERTLRPAPSGTRAANDETAMAIGGPDLPPAVRAADVLERALP